MIAPPLNTRLFVEVSGVLGDDHYTRIPHVTVDVARWRTLTAQWPWVPSIGQNLQPFTGNGYVSMSEKFSSGRITPPPPKKPHQIYTYLMTPLLDRSKALYTGSSKELTIDFDSRPNSFCRTSPANPKCCNRTKSNRQSVDRQKLGFQCFDFSGNV